MKKSLSQNGFTLIEVLIAFTLLSVLLVLLFGMLGVSAKSWNQGEAKLVELNRKSVAYQFFRSYLSNIRAIHYQPNQADDNSTENSRLAFIGYSQSLSFVAPMPRAAIGSQLQIVTIQPDKRKPTDITVTLADFFAGKKSSVTDSAVLLQEVKKITFSYYGEKSKDEEPAWYEDWNSSNKLPSLIEISIELTDGSPWPAMVFPVRIDGQAMTNAK